MYERFTDNAREVLQRASLEARRLHHDHLGDEHILLGLLTGGRAAARATEGYRRETCVTDDLDRSRARLLTGDMDIGNSHRPPGVTVDELGAFRERVTARIRKEAIANVVRHWSLDA